MVSSLSQGVPALATGWSHKYEMLFDDYEFLDRMISVSSNDEAIASRIDSLINTEKNTKLKLKRKSKLLKKQSEKMWLSIFTLIDETMENKKI